jgi:hypothetical protein
VRVLSEERWCLGEGELTRLKIAVHFRNRERISFDHLVSMKKAGETAKVTVMRAGQELHFDIKLGPVRRTVSLFTPSCPMFLFWAWIVKTNHLGIDALCMFTVIILS